MSMRVVIRNAEAYTTIPKPELWAGDTLIPIGEEKSFDLEVGTELKVELRLTEELQKIQDETAKADEEVMKERREGPKGEKKEASTRPGSAANPGAKVEGPKTSGEARSGVDSREVKGEAPLKR